VKYGEISVMGQHLLDQKFLEVEQHQEQVFAQMNHHQNHIRTG
jgi:hypothetical protein